MFSNNNLRTDITSKNAENWLTFFRLTLDTFLLNFGKP